MIKYIKKHYPSLYRKYRSTSFYERSEARRHQRKEPKRLKRIKQWQDAFKRLFNGKLEVLHGPFKGLKYIDEATCSVFLPKIVGSYEEPIHPWIYEVIERNYSTLIDLGCAEGYFAVGLAAKCKNASVHAFDVDDNAGALITKLLKTNNLTDQVKVKINYELSEVEELIDDATFIMCDIEGAEYDLLDPEKIPSLKKCDIVLEVHDCMVPGITEKLVETFSETHKIEIVYDYKRDKSLYPEILKFEQSDIDLVLDERRPKAMSWMRLSHLT